MRFLIALFIFSINNSLHAQNDGPWEYHQSLEGTFSIQWPGEFFTRVDSVDTPLGILAYHTFFHQNPKEEQGDNIMYMLSYCDYPSGGMHSDSTALLNEFFAATMEQAAKSVIGKVMYNDEIWLGDYPGRFFRIDYLDGKAVIKTQAFLVENRYYTIQTVTIAQKSLNRSTDYFFESFKVIE